MGAKVLLVNDNLEAIKSDGTVATPVRTGASKGCTLSSGTWYFEFGASIREVREISAHLKWAAPVAGVARISFCDFPAKEADGTTADVASNSSTAGDWILQDPPGAYVAVTPTGGNSSTGAVVTLGGTNAGGCTFELPTNGARRARLELVLTVGGLVRCGLNAKD